MLKRMTLRENASSNLHEFERINSTIFSFNIEPHPSDFYSYEERGSMEETIGGNRIVQSFGFHECDRIITLSTYLKEDWALDLIDARATRKEWRLVNWQGIERIVRFNIGKEGLIVEFVNAKFPTGEWAYRADMSFLILQNPDA